MKNRYTLFASLIVLIVMLFSGIVCVFADNEATTAPVQQETTVPVDNTVSGTTSAQSTETTDPSGTVSPTGTTSLTESTETTVSETYYTEYDPNNAPSTFTPYYPDEGLVDASEYTGTAASWDEDIDPSEVLSLSGGKVSGVGDFSGIKDNTSKEDENEKIFSRIGWTLIILSIVGFIFIPVSFIISNSQETKAKQKNRM